MNGPGMPGFAGKNEGFNNPVLFGPGIAWSNLEH
jgi:hypothetical protein